MERIEGAYTFKELYEKACEYGAENCYIGIGITDKFHKFQTSGYITDENLNWDPGEGSFINLDIQKNVEPYEP